MCTPIELQKIISQLRESITEIFPHERMDIILYGSYARNSADDESDIDVMILVDSSRKTIAERNWQIGEAAAECLLTSGILVSPVVENREFYHENIDILPFFRNIHDEGVFMNV